MLCVEDALNSLKWAASIGGLPALIDRVEANSKATFEWAEASPWIDFLAREPNVRSKTSVALTIVDPWLKKQDQELQYNIGRRLSSLLDSEGTAYDIANHIAAPPGLRIWNGATVETTDLEALFPWLDWGWSVLKTKGTNNG